MFGFQVLGIQMVTVLADGRAVYLQLSLRFTKLYILIQPWWLSGIMNSKFK